MGNPAERTGEKAGEPSELAAELRGLRKGHGLSAVKLGACPHVLEALGTDDSQLALDRLTERIARLGAGPEATALRNAYAIGMDDPGVVTNRRASLATRSGKHKDTIEAYENAAVDELAAGLTGQRKATGWVDPFVGETVSVWAIVADRSVLSIAQNQEPDSEGRPAATRYIHNPGVPPGAPALLYQLPESWQVEQLILVVLFMRGSMPSRAWASRASSLLELPLGRWREEIGEAKEQALVYPASAPLPGEYFALFWEW